MKTRSSAFCDLLPLATLLPKYPSSHRHSDTQTNAPNSFLSQWTLIPLLFTPHASPPRLPASLDFCALLCALLRGKLLPLLLLSFFRLLQRDFDFDFFFFNFCLIWSEEYVLKVEICYQNTKQHWSATKNHQVPTNLEAFIFINFFFFTECGFEHVLGLNMFWVWTCTGKLCWVFLFVCWEWWGGIKRGANW